MNFIRSTMCEESLMKCTNALFQLCCGALLNSLPLWKSGIKFNIYGLVYFIHIGDWKTIVTVLFTCLIRLYNSHYVAKTFRDPQNMLFLNLPVILSGNSCFHHLLFLKLFLKLTKIIP